MVPFPRREEAMGLLEEIRLLSYASVARHLINAAPKAIAGRVDTWRQFPARVAVVTSYSEGEQLDSPLVRKVSVSTLKPNTNPIWSPFR